MEPDVVIPIFYHEVENLFTDSCCKIIYDIFSMITPNDLIMFKKFGHHDYIRHRYDPRIMIDLIYISNIDNERIEYDEQSYLDTFNNFCSRNDCRFSHREKDVRKEICQTCAGRN